MTTPPLVTNEDMNGLWSGARGDLWVVTSRGNLFHYAGGTWTLTGSFAGTVLRDIWGASSTNIWAGGDGGALAHWDGSTWTPRPSGTASAFGRIVGASGADVYALAGGVLYHFDGVSWATTTTSVTSISALAPTFGGVWVAGFTSGTPRIERLIGTTRYALTPPASVSAMAEASNGEVYTMNTTDDTLRYYDGFVWRSVATVSPIDPRMIWAAAPHDVVVVGRGIVRFH
jgi:hypothetical protein